MQRFDQFQETKMINQISDVVEVTSVARSQDAIDKLREIVLEFLKQTTNPLESLDAATLANISLCFLEFADFKDYDSGVNFASKAIDKLNALNLIVEIDEARARAHYMLGTKERELNRTESADNHYAQALALAQTPWLISNIYRNQGLSQLKYDDDPRFPNNFVTAAERFERAISCAKGHEHLKGSLPALVNYWALALTRHAIKNNLAPGSGLALFDRAAAAYEKYFEQFEESQRERIRLRSNDYQSHLFHRGLVNAKLGTKAALAGNHAQAELYFMEAIPFLKNALDGRIKNGQKASRLADIQTYLAEAYLGTNQLDLAEVNVRAARTGYTASGFEQVCAQIQKVDGLYSTVGWKRAKEIDDKNRGRLQVSASVLPRQGAFTTTVVSTAPLTNLLGARPKSPGLNN